VKGEETDESSDVAQLFRRAAGADMEIDWMELQKVLNSSFQRRKFSFESDGCLYLCHINHVALTIIVELDVI